MPAKPGRNEACPCGSGKKFKHCCGQDAAAASLDPREIDALAALVNTGRASEAEAKTHQLLERFPQIGMLWKILSVALVRQGKEALPALRRTAELMPDDAEAHSNLGATLRARGLWSEALASFQTSLELRPGHLDTLSQAAEAQNNLGNALFDAGRYADAVDCYQAALQIKTDNAKIHSNLANAFRRLGRLPEATASSRRAIALNPTLGEAHNNLGLALAAQGQFEAAAESYKRALSLDAGYVDALNNLGNSLRDLGQRRECLAVYARAIDLDPTRAASHCNLGNVLFELRRIDEAAASYRRALSLEPDYGAAHLSLSMALRMLGDTAAAEASCEKALALDPNYVEALSLLGELRADRGQFTEAQELFQRALTLDPEFPFAFFSIAMHRKMTGEDGAWLKGVSALLAKRLPLRYEISLRYGLGKYFDDLKHYDQAFDNYRRANELTKRNGLVYDAARLARHVDRIIDSFDAASMRAAQVRGNPSERPVFIVGMPRSGTSLTEQILASHPGVFGAGELSFWDGAFSTYEAAGLEGHQGAHLIPRMAVEYLEQLTHVSGGALRVVDKMPPNFMNLGLIHAAFPRARIIHMQRHPIDTCLSIYFQYFLNTHPYANDLGSLAHYYGEYLKIMDHWRATIPASALLEIPYEALIEDQEGWTRRMLDFVGVPWDPKCLDFHRTDRVVITASKWQVRQKIHASSAGRWKNYEKFVGPLQHLVSLAARR
jgi:tetratricopeptide (TPR) repeat protein